MSRPRAGSAEGPGPAHLRGPAPPSATPTRSWTWAARAGAGRLPTAHSLSALPACSAVLQAAGCSLCPSWGTGAPQRLLCLCGTPWTSEPLLTAGGREAPGLRVVRSPGPAGGQGCRCSGRGRAGGRGRAPPCEAERACWLSRGGPPGGPGAPAPCCRLPVPRGAGTRMSRCASVSWSPRLDREAYLLQESWRGEGGDDGAGHGGADPVELHDLPLPGLPQPTAIPGYPHTCGPAPCRAEGKGLGLPVLPAVGRTGAFADLTRGQALLRPAAQGRGVGGSHLNGRWARALVRARTC